MELPSQYAGKCLALIDNKIIATGKTQLEAYTKAKKCFPDKLITLMYVPRKEEITDDLLLQLEVSLRDMEAGKLKRVR